MTNPIRILPMSSEDDDFHDEFHDFSAEEVQRDFFIEYLMEGGEYHYRHAGLNANPGTLVLFQYDNQIIAKAKLHQTRRLNTGDYKGALSFSSVKVFTPVGFDRMKRIWPKELRNFIHFTNAKLKLNPEAYRKFAPLTRIMAFAKGEASERIKQSEFAETRQIARERTFFARNPELSRCAKERDSYTCQICYFNFVDVYGKLGRHFAECHHLDPLSERLLASDCTTSTNLDRVVTLCANCHRMVHRERPALKVEHVKADFARAADLRGGPYILPPDANS